MFPSQIEALDRVQKSQHVRALDVVVIGPLMVWGGSALTRRCKLAGGLLMLFGVSTVVYNARNWRRMRSARRSVGRPSRARR